MSEARHTATVLLVGDDPAARTATTAVLEGAGYAVVQVGLEGARACVLERLVDAIVLDLPDPEVAEETARQLKADCIAPLVPLLQLTTTEHEARPLARSLEASAHTLLAKPVTPEVLLSTMSTLVRLGRAYREVHQERTRLEEVLLQMPSGVIIADAEGQLHLTNERAREILCLPEVPRPQEERVRELRPARQGTPAGIEGWPLWRALHTGERVIGEEFEVTCGDGRRIVARVSAGPIRSPEGEIIAGVLTFTDVTSLKEAEEEHRQLHAEADRHRAHLEAIQESVPVGIVYLDRDFRVQYANPAAEGFARLPREALVGQCILGLFPGPQGEALFELARTSGEPVQREEVPFVFANQPERGLTYWSGALVPLKDDRGEVTGFVLTVTEVTEQVRQREQTLAAERARAELAETLNAEVNHRVKNNLAMAAALLQMQGMEDGDPKVATLLEEAASRLLTLAQVHEQLQVSREGRVDLLAGIRRLTQATSEVLVTKGIDFAVEGEPVEMPPRAATNLLIVANELVTNAAKYCEPTNGDTCAVRVGVRVGLAVRDRKLVLSVWNSGNPVPEDFDVTRAAGMGLRVVRALVVDQYRGAFSLRPHEAGTTAQVVVPLAHLQQE